MTIFARKSRKFNGCLVRRQSNFQIAVAHMHVRLHHTFTLNSHGTYISQHNGPSASLAAAADLSARRPASRHLHLHLHPDTGSLSSINDAGGFAYAVPASAPAYSSTSISNHRTQHLWWHISSAFPNFES